MKYKDIFEDEEKAVERLDSWDIAEALTNSGFNTKPRDIERSQFARRYSESGDAIYVVIFKDDGSFDSGDDEEDDYDNVLERATKIYVRERDGKFFADY